MFGKLNNIVTAPHVQCYSHADHACYSVEQRLRSYRNSLKFAFRTICVLSKNRKQKHRKNIHSLCSTTGRSTSTREHYNVIVASLKPGFQLNATHATQPIALRALRALRKRKPQETQGIALRALRALRKRKPQTMQAFDWLL